MPLKLLDCLRIWTDTLLSSTQIMGIPLAYFTQSRSALAPWSPIEHLTKPSFVKVVGRELTLPNTAPPIFQRKVIHMAIAKLAVPHTGIVMLVGRSIVYLSFHSTSYFFKIVKEHLKSPCRFAPHHSFLDVVSIHCRLGQTPKIRNASP